MNGKVIVTCTVLLLSLVGNTTHAASPAIAHSMMDHFIPLDQLRQQLNLTPEQQQEWQQIADQAGASSQQIHDKWRQIIQIYKKELEKSEPDLARVATLVDEVREQQLQNQRSISQKHLAFYANLTPEQKTTVKNALKQRLDRFEQMWNGVSGLEPPK